MLLTTSNVFADIGCKDVSVASWGDDDVVEWCILNNNTIETVEEYEVCDDPNAGETCGISIYLKYRAAIDCLKNQDEYYHKIVGVCKQDDVSEQDE